MFKQRPLVFALMLISLTSMAILQGCGGGGGGLQKSVVTGTVSDLDRNVLIGATVKVDDTHQTKSLITGIYRMEDVDSGWKTIWAEAVVNGTKWVGSTAVEVLQNEPTMNANIVLAPAAKTMSISGYVSDHLGYAVKGARVLLTTRIVSLNNTSSSDGPYGSIVAITDGNGRYTLEDVPIGYKGTISASLVGYYNNQRSIDTSTASARQDFALSLSNLTTTPLSPTLDFVESYTMPNPIVRSTGGNPYDAIKAVSSLKYRNSLKNPAKRAIKRNTTMGSLIEVDMYFDGLGKNPSESIAGYGIYRSTDPNRESRSIDFVRDPYANFYSDTGSEITPGVDYYYQVSSVDVQYLTSDNQFDPYSESNMSKRVQIRPLDQLHSLLPSQGSSVSAAPTLSWSAVNGASSYYVYVYSEFPTLPLDPSNASNYTDPAASSGTYPIWISNQLSGSSVVYSGSTKLVSGHDYYWVVIAENSQGENSAAYSYSELRHFTVR